MTRLINAQVLVIGSGAGGATTALELAQAGYEVLVLEEGNRHQLSDYGRDSVSAMQLLYRNHGMTPIMGTSPIGFVEGCSLGGSTEINNGLWRRLPAQKILCWRNDYGLDDLTETSLDAHFTWAEQLLSVTTPKSPLPRSSSLFQKGAQSLGWNIDVVSRAASGCVNTNRCVSGCPKGAKQGMSLNLIPQAEAAGASFLTKCRVLRLIREGSSITGVHAEIDDGRGKISKIKIKAKHIFLCAGSTQTPSILRRSGIKRGIGDSLKMHLTLKVVALFDEIIDSQHYVLPLLQVSQPDFFLGGCYFSTGHLAALLSKNWESNHQLMFNYPRTAIYSVNVCGSGRGTVRTVPLDNSKTIMHYELSHLDRYKLGKGLTALSKLLLAAGAKELYPCIVGLPKITSDAGANQWLQNPIPDPALGLTTVHAFSTCPLGRQAAVDSFGKVHGIENLYVNDASMLPDSPGVNPQATIMAICRRNVRNFIECSV